MHAAQQGGRPRRTGPGRHGRRWPAAVAVLAAAATASGCALQDGPERRSAAALRPVVVAPAAATATPATATSTAPATPAATPPTSASGATTARPATAYDLDGDRVRDAISLTRVEGLGWSFDVTLSRTGVLQSAPLDERELEAVAEDVAVVASADLDRDGRAEVLVRTLRAVAGDNRVVVRLDRGTVWLVRDAQERPWVLSSAGGTSGPRSFDCRQVVASRQGREVRTSEASRQGGAGAAPRYEGVLRTWALSGRRAVQLTAKPFDGVPASSPLLGLDPATCRR